jgi:ubiquitin carboxyl-terminal hydrolase 4/11/15
LKNKVEIDEIELNDIYYKQYNLIFNENYQKSLNIDEKVKKDIQEYLEKFPFKCYLTSTKGEGDRLFFSSNNTENQNSFKDSQKINDIIKLIRNKYKLILYITKKEYIQPLNEIISIQSIKDNKDVKTPTLTDSLIHFSLHEKLEKDNEYFCPNCKRHVNAYHKSDIFYMPPYLIISIKRFVRNYLSKTKVQLLKVNDILEYNINYIDFDNFVSGPKNPKNMYTLYAVNQHSGSNEGGHYCSACKNFGKWYMYDDHAVFTCDNDMICVPEGYLLFYRRVKDYKKLIENSKVKNIYLEFYQKKDGKNDEETESKKDNNLKEDIKEAEEESEGEENEDDEEQ